MPNPIKYTTGSETNALKKGNFYIGTGDVGKGPSDTTGFYQGISPSSGGYVIYMNKSGAPGSLSYHNAPTDAELISFTNSLAGQSYTTVNECLTYYAEQTDKVCVNRDYEGIVTDGLVLNLDAGFIPSYPKNGTTWYDVGGTNNGTLTNGPTFDSGNGGSIVFDGSNDYVDCGNPSTLNFTSTYTLSAWCYLTNKGAPGNFITHKADAYGISYKWAGSGSQLDRFVFNVRISGGWLSIYSLTGIDLNRWYHVTGTNDGSDMKLYIDTQLMDTKSTGGIITSTSSNILAIGLSKAGASLDYPWKGNIPTVQIYNRALSADEVLQNYNAQKGRFGL